MKKDSQPITLSAFNLYPELALSIHAPASLQPHAAPIAYYEPQNITGTKNSFLAKLIKLFRTASYASAENITPATENA